MNLTGLVDFQAELKKNRTKNEQLSKQIETLEKRMSQPSYSKVPQNVQESDAEKLSSFKIQSEALLSIISILEQNVSS